MTNQTKNTPAAREDAEEEQRTPQAGDVLTEQQALLTDKMQQACQMLVQTIIKERAESKRKDEIIKLKDEVISRKDKEIALKDEELAWMRAESERKDAAHAKELDRVRANEIAFRKAAVTFLRETPVESRKNAQTFPVALETLNTLKARSLIEKLINSGLLDEHWQPVNLSNAEKGILAQYLSGELNIKNPWQFFASLWSMKPETLRIAFNKALDQNKSLVFQDRLKGLLKE